MIEILIQFLKIFNSRKSFLLTPFRSEVGINFLEMGTELEEIFK